MEGKDGPIYLNLFEEVTNNYEVSSLRLMEIDYLDIRENTCVLKNVFFFNSKCIVN